MFAGNFSISWLNDFAESFTCYDASSRRRGARWIAANQAQLAQEAQTTDRALYSITEISRTIIARYRDRFSSNVLPGWKDGQDWFSFLY